MAKKIQRVPGAIVKDIHESLRGKSKEPTLSDIALEFMRLCGGPTGFAVALHKTYIDTNTQGFVKARIADTMMRAMKYQEDKRPPMDGAQQLTQDELESEIGELLKECIETDGRFDPQVRLGPEQAGDAAGMAAQEGISGPVPAGATGSPEPAASPGAAAVSDGAPPGADARAGEAENLSPSPVRAAPPAGELPCVEGEGTPA